MAIPEPERKLLRTITPADVAAVERCHARCLDCAWTSRARYRETVETVGEFHVSEHGHHVVIEEEIT